VDSMIEEIRIWMTGMNCGMIMSGAGLIDGLTLLGWLL
jgi:hypothetical protein